MLFSGGLKPPLLVCYFQVERRRSLACHYVVGQFEIWRVGYHSALFCLMLFACQFLYNARAQLTWQRMYLVNVGTWVRFPGPLCIFHNFFFNLFLRSVPFSDPPCTLINGLPSGHERPSSGQEPKSMEYPSQRVCM